MLGRTPKWLAAVALASSLSGCYSLDSLYSLWDGDRDGPPKPALAQAEPIVDAKPQHEPLSPYGNPDSYQVDGQRYHVLKDVQHYHKRGLASWYGRKFQGRLTSTHEPYDMMAMTAASTELPIPCYVRVTNLDNGKSTVVRVNDRGPFKKHRILDLSYAAARRLDMLKYGTAPVDVELLSSPAGLKNPAPTHESPIALPQDLNQTDTPAQTLPQGQVEENEPSVPIVTAEAEPQHPMTFARRHEHRHVAVAARPVEDIDEAEAVQVGVFSSKANAVRLQRKLQRVTKGRVLIQPMVAHNELYYRVLATR